MAQEKLERQQEQQQLQHLHQQQQQQEWKGPHMAGQQLLLPAQQVCSGQWPVSLQSLLERQQEQQQLQHLHQQQQQEWKGHPLLQQRLPLPAQGLFPGQPWRLQHLQQQQEQKGTDALQQQVQLLMQQETSGQPPQPSLQLQQPSSLQQIAKLQRLLQQQQKGPQDTHQQERHREGAGDSATPSTCTGLAPQLESSTLPQQQRALGDAATRLLAKMHEVRQQQQQQEEELSERLRTSGADMLFEQAQAGSTLHQSITGRGSQGPGMQQAVDILLRLEARMEALESQVMTKFEEVLGRLDRLEQGRRPEVGKLDV
jgi:hypothetical protein